MYVVSSKAIGFNLEVTSADAAMAITGVRINIGNQDINRAPSFIQVSPPHIPLGHIIE
jgi:E3 ubiquitin-protein ligase UBR4